MRAAETSASNCFARHTDTLYASGMNGDAQEAALGLLSMGNNYFTQPTPSAATSSATLNSILTTTASPLATLSTIPQKRKQGAVESETRSPSVTFYTPHLDSINDHYQRQETPQRLQLTPLPNSLSPEPTPSTPQANGAQGLPTQEPKPVSSEALDCICELVIDDGFSIACDICSRWCHAACFGIAKEEEVPDKFMCWTCKPRPLGDKERAIRLQKERLAFGSVGGDAGDGKEAAKHRRRASPGLERKQRRTGVSVTSTSVTGVAGLEIGKKKRRPSVVQHPPVPSLPTNSIIAAQATPNPEEEHIEIDNEPWKEAYVHISDDIIPNDDTRAKLRRQAAHWRGVTAIGSPASPVVVPPALLQTPPPVTIKELPPSSTLNPFLALNSNPEVLPPTYSLHTTQPISSQSLITPFKACITPSSSYLADPLNAYAHLGMPKPYVHLLGPPFEVALDARLVGNHSRFVRRGCKPNAVLRPVLCDGKGEQATDGNHEKDHTDESSLGFGVFALRDLKANEEVVLGWEWDDGNAVHNLPALLDAPLTFP